MPTDLIRIKDALQSIHHRWAIYSKADLEELNLLETDKPVDLITFLTLKLNHIPDSEWLDRLNWGGAYINGIVSYENKEIPCPAIVEYYEPKDWTNRLELLADFEIANNIVYEDEYFAVLFKPAKMHVLPAKEQQHINLKILLEKHYQKKIHLPSRLDYSTSGLIIISHSEQAHGHLQRLFEHRKIQKTYLALASFECSWKSCTINKNITKDERHPILRKTSLSEGSYAITEFDCLARKAKEGKTYSLIKAKPITGRTHQIRVHLEALGLPIVGDNFYGGDESVDGLHLLSYSLEFRHPISNKDTEIHLPNKFTPRWANF